MIRPFGYFKHHCYFTDFKLFWIWCPNLSLTKVDDYDLYALLYAGDDEDNKFTPEQAHQAAEKANGRVTGSATDGETAETAEDGEAHLNPQFRQSLFQ